MRYFEYNDDNSLAILDETPLVIASFETKAQTIKGSARQNLSTTRTYYRPVANEFGAVYKDVLTFEMALIKCNGYPFTADEQVLIERWLTSPKLSKWMVFSDTANDDDVLYYGKVVSTEWEVYGGGYAGVTIEFENNAPYPWIPVVQTYKYEDGAYYMWDGDEWYPQEGSVLSVYCETDELEETIFPKLTFTTTEKKSDISITNATDDNKKLTMTMYKDLPVVVDCRNNILRDELTGELVTYKDVGWDDLDNIYWMQLYPGENNLTVDGGNLEIKVEYNAPYKRVGGWWG